MNPFVDQQITCNAWHIKPIATRIVLTALPLWKCQLKPIGLQRATTWAAFATGGEVVCIVEGEIPSDLPRQSRHEGARRGVEECKLVFFFRKRRSGCCRDSMRRGLRWCGGFLPTPKAATATDRVGQTGAERETGCEAYAPQRQQEQQQQLWTRPFLPHYALLQQRGHARRWIISGAADRCRRHLRLQRWSFMVTWN